MIDVPTAQGRLRSDRCLIMGILNATPDSFSDGGRLDAEGASAMAARLIEEGADILDVGGESTRPGHALVSIDDELDRVLPVIEAIRDVDAQVPISIDTSKWGVAEAALDVGASFVNDVDGLRDPSMARLVAKRGVAAVVMRREPCRGPIVQAARNQLHRHVAFAMAHGVPKGHLVLDPGLGFGARPGPDVAQNLALIDGLDGLGASPVLIGASRKRFVAAWGEAKGLDRTQASVAVAVRARDAGAAIVRVHDVAATVEAFA